MDATRLEAEAEVNIAKAKELSEAINAIAEILRPFYEFGTFCGFAGFEKTFIQQSLSMLSSNIHIFITREVGYNHIHGLLKLLEHWYDNLDPVNKLQIQKHIELVGQSKQTINDIHFSLRPPAILSEQ